MYLVEIVILFFELSLNVNKFNEKHFAYNHENILIRFIAGIYMDG